MDLHSIVSGAIGTVNPFILASIEMSSGYTTTASGKQVPAYFPAINQLIQVQALQYNDIAQLDGLNIQGERRAIYLEGFWSGVIRSDSKGGDLLTFPEYPGGALRTWLVVQVLEHWPDWSKLAVTLQDDLHV